MECGNHPVLHVQVSSGTTSNLAKGHKQIQRTISSSGPLANFTTFSPPEEPKSKQVICFTTAPDLGTTFITRRHMQICFGDDLLDTSQLTQQGILPHQSSKSGCRCDMGTYHIVPEWRRTVPETWIMLLICIQSECCSKIWDTSADQTPFFCDVCCAAHARITNRYELCERGVFLDGSHTRQSDYTRQPNPNRIWKVAGQGGWPDWRTNNARSLCCGVMGDWGWLDHWNSL